MFDTYKLLVFKHILSSLFVELKAVGIGKIIHYHRYVYAVGDIVVISLDSLIGKSVVEGSDG